MDPIKQLLNVPPEGTAHLTADEIASLSSTRNEREWNAAVEAITKARGGSYPPDWAASVMVSGLHYEIVSLWRLRDGVISKLACSQTAV
jgi:hypothetical protein